MSQVEPLWDAVFDYGKASASEAHARAREVRRCQSSGDGIWRGTLLRGWLRPLLPKDVQGPEDVERLRARLGEEWAAGRAHVAEATARYLALARP